MVLKRSRIGGYGIVFGDPEASQALAAVSQKIRDDPRSWIAQPMCLELSTVPTRIERHAGAPLRGLAARSRSTTVTRYGCCRRADPSGVG